MIRRALLVLAVLACPALAAAQGNLFAMDGTGGFSTSTFNFDSFTSDSHVTMSRQTGICPSGGDAIRYVLVSDTVHSQPSWGHAKAVSDTVAQGAKRFYRIRIRFNAPTDFSGNNGPWYSKWNIFGANAGRVIVHFGVGGINNTTPNAWVSKNVDLNPPNRVALNTSSGWNNLQFRLQSSSTSGASDGRVDTYLGSANTSESTPSDSETGVNIDLTGNGGADGWSNPSVGAGGFNQTTITSSGSVSMDLCDVQYGTAFDTSWNSPGGGAAPTVGGISPSSGTTSGGTSVTITGTGFTATPTVAIGGTTCTSPHFTSSTQIECTTGARSAATVDVVVTNPDAQAGTLSNGYTYTTPASGPYRFRFKAEMWHWSGLFAAAFILFPLTRKRS